jgi:hypothetical protein
MSKETAKNRLIVSSRPALYQQLLSGINNYEQLAARMLGQIKTAHAFRQTEKVRELSRILINIPIKEYQLIAQYYLVWCRCRDFDFHDHVLERIAEQSYSYRTQALISRAAFDFYRGKFEGALRFYAESLKARPTISEYLSAVKGIAVIKSLEGFGRSALNDLENLTPLLRYANPIVYYDMLNSYAVELGEAGREDEGRNIMHHVLASPFAHAYPEWRETAEDLRPARRSFVALSSVPYNILTLPEREPGQRPSLELNLARVFNFAKLKQKIVKEKQDKNLARQLDNMSERDLGFKLLEIITQYRPTKRQLRAIVDFALHLLSYPTDPDEPDKPAS